MCTVHVCIEPNLLSLSGEVLQGASSNTQDGAMELVLTLQPTDFFGGGGGHYQNLFQCKNVQFPCSFSLPLQLSHYIQEARSFENTMYTSLWTKDQRDVAILFHPTGFFNYGWRGKEATAFYKCLDSCFTFKCEQHYSYTLFWLHVLITCTFSLLRSAMQCIHGTHSHIGHASRISPALDLAISELHVHFLVWLSVTFFT